MPAIVLSTGWEREKLNDIYGFYFSEAYSMEVSREGR